MRSISIKRITFSLDFNFPSHKQAHRKILSIKSGTTRAHLIACALNALLDDHLTDAEISSQVYRFLEDPKGYALVKKKRSVDSKEIPGAVVGGEVSVAIPADIPIPRRESAKAVASGTRKVVPGLS